LKAKNCNKEILRFIILIPHRDAVNHLARYREKLFSLGVYGAHSFPLAAPLARVSRPFTREELKELAAAIRGLTKENDGKFLCGAVSAVQRAGEISFFGPPLNLGEGETVFSPAQREKILKSFLPAVLCAAIVGQGNSTLNKNILSEEAPILSFRVAALANLSLRPLEEGDTAYSFEWRMGPRVWLPAHKKVKNV